MGETEDKMLEAPGAGVTQDAKLMAMLSYLLGIFTSALFRWRTRARRA